jgi:hypothetical protein
VTLKRQIFATLAALVVIATHVAGVGHYVLVAHYFCAEHGTLHEGAPEAAPEASSDSRDAASIDTRDEHAHDECNYFSRGNDVATSVSGAPSIVLSDEAPPRLVAASTDARVTLEILGFAPKQSPPLAS